MAEKEVIDLSSSTQDSGDSEKTGLHSTSNRKGDEDPLIRMKSYLEGFVAVEFSVVDGDRLAVDFHVPESNGIVPWKHEMIVDRSTNRVISRKLPRLPKRGDTVEFPIRLAEGLDIDKKFMTIPITDAAGVISISHNPEFQLLLQTPLDDGPFFCAQMTPVQSKDHLRFCHGGVIAYCNGDNFTPEKVIQEQLFMYRWRWSRNPAFVPILGFLAFHSEYISTRLEFLHSELLSIEEMLIIGAANTTSPDQGPDYGHLTKRLQLFGTSVSNLSRRQHFQKHVIDEMNTMLREFSDEVTFAQMQSAIVDKLVSALKGREFDLEMLPKREQIAKTTMFNLIVQRDQAMSIRVGQANLEMAQNSAAIAEASMRESSAMSTIAILTMIFLPGTFMASIFGMSMFSYQGGQIEVSPYIWVFFVFSAVLTLIVLIAWWFWSRSRERRMRNRISSTFSTIEM